MYLVNYPYFWLLLLPILVYLYLVWQEKRSSEIFKGLGDEKVLRKLSNIYPLHSRIKRWLLIVAILFLVIALLRPQWGKRNDTVERRGLDIVYLLDISSSMSAEDILPNRLERAVMEINALTSRLKGDRVALVTFSGSATPVCPLTLDYNALDVFLKGLKFYSEYIPGTNLEQGYRTAAALYDPKTPQDKAMLIFTDGESHQGDLEWIKNDARNKGILLIPVAVGTASGQPLPAYDDKENRIGYKKDKKGQIIISHLDLASLQKIAMLGPYDLDTTEDVSGQIMSDLSGLKRSKLKELRLSLYTERYQFFLFMGLILLSAAYSLTIYQDRRRA